MVRDFDDNEFPLAYLISFRTYGTWLHGDKRGSVDREHNQYETAYAPANENRSRHNQGMLKDKPVVLNAFQRSSVEKAIRETCVLRRWTLHTINVRTNHVHTVVSIGNTKSEIALNAFKANATRQMRQDGGWDMSHSPWVDKGSRRNLWNERSVERAIDYVNNSQGGPLPDFD